MALTSDDTVRVTGLKELQSAMRRAGNKDVPRAVRLVNKNLAQQVVDLALPRVPVNTGRLQRSVKALGGVRDAKAKAGSAARVPYAPPIHWGWPAHGIRPNPFLWNALARARSNEHFEDEYLKALMDAIYSAMDSVPTP